MPRYMMIAMDADHTPTIQARIMCEETMEATQGAMLTHTAHHVLKTKAAYELIPRWKIITRYLARVEARGMLKLANYMAEVELIP
jgi:hypothetical protein